jgi:hypothetical protein
MKSLYLFFIRREKEVAVSPFFSGEKQQGVRKSGR